MKTKEQVYQEVFPTTVEEVLYAMQLYSDQQNKELREELEKWKATMTKHHDELVAENVKLIQQAGFANTIQEQMQIRIKQDIESLEEADRDWNSLKTKSDHQIRIHQETIQRLTKEVEKLENDRAEFAMVLAAGSDENTRLRELLERIKKVAGNDLNRYYAGLSKDIDNELNPKL